MSANTAALEMARNLVAFADSNRRINLTGPLGAAVEQARAIVAEGKASASQPPAAGEAVDTLTLSKPTEQMLGRWFAYAYQGGRTAYQVFGESAAEVLARCEVLNQYAALKAKAERWEKVSEMGPAWVSASLEQMALERREADKMRASLERIKSGLPDDRAYREEARRALLSGQPAPAPKIDHAEKLAEAVAELAELLRYDGRGHVLNAVDRSRAALADYREGKPV